MCLQSWLCVVFAILVCFQSLVGAEWFLDRIYEMRTAFKAQTAISVSKVNTSFFLADARFCSAAKCVASCWAARRSRVDLDHSQQQEALDSQQGERVSGSMTLPILREVVAVGEYDPVVDSQCRKHFLLMAGLMKDPVTVAAVKEAGKQVDAGKSVAKPQPGRQRPKEKVDNPEHFSDGDSSHVSVFQKPVQAPVEYLALQMDVMDPAARAQVFAPMSQTIHLLAFDCPYEMGPTSYGSWDRLIPEDQVCVCV